MFSEYASLVLKTEELKKDLKQISTGLEEVDSNIKAKRQGDSKKDPDISKREDLLLQQQREVSSLNKEIERKKKELTEVYHLAQVRSLEDNILDQKRQIEQLQKNKQNLEKMVVPPPGYQQQEEEAIQKESDLKAVIKDYREDNKVLIEKKKELDREVQTHHLKSINLDRKNRGLKREIAQAKSHKNLRETLPEEAFDQRAAEERLQLLKEEKEEAYQIYLEEMKKIESLRTAIRKDTDSLSKLLRERERNARALGLKIKEYRRVGRYRGTNHAITQLNTPSKEPKQPHNKSSSHFSPDNKSQEDQGSEKNAYLDDKLQALLKN